MDHGWQPECIKAGVIARPRLGLATPKQHQDAQWGLKMDEMK